MNNLIKLPANTKGRDFVVGDLHGCYYHLMDALSAVNFTGDKDRLFCVGDLIDRGEYSIQCVELLFEPWFFSVRGNHEMFMLNGDLEVWYMPGNGGSWYASVDQHLKRFLRKTIQEKCPVAYEVEHKDGFTFGIVHAQTPNDDWNEIDWDNHYVQENALWGRDKLRAGVKVNYLEPIRNIDLVFHGHTPTKEVIRLGNEVWCDLGVVFRDTDFVLLDVSEEFKTSIYS